MVIILSYPRFGWAVDQRNLIDGFHAKSDSTWKWLNHNCHDPHSHMQAAVAAPAKRRPAPYPCGVSSFTGAIRATLAYSPSLLRTESTEIAHDHNDQVIAILLHKNKFASIDQWLPQLLF